MKAKEHYVFIEFNRKKRIIAQVKYILSFAISLVLISEIKAQSSVALGFNSTGGGRGITGVYYSQKDKNELGIGLRFNINYSHNLDDQSKVFYKRIYALKPIHRFGLSASLQRYIFTNYKITSFFAFYNVQATYAMAKNHQFRMSDSDSLGILYTNKELYLGPFTWVEQNLGIGHKMQLTDKVYLIQKLGFGTMFIIGREKTAVLDNDITKHYFKRFSWEFGYLFNTGLGYNF